MECAAENAAVYQGDQQGQVQWRPHHVVNYKKGDIIQ